MRTAEKTSGTIIAAAVLGGGALLGGSAWLWSRYGKREPPELELVALEPGIGPLGNVGESEGEITRDFPANPGGRGIDARTIRVGPMVKSIPVGTRLLVDVMLIVPALPPAIPGGSETSCQAIGARIRFSDSLAVNWPTYEEQIELGCTKLQKRGGVDYDVRFPDFRLKKDPRGIYFAYTWIAFGHPQSVHPSTYTAKPHQLRLRWELVEVPS